MSAAMSHESHTCWLWSRHVRSSRQEFLMGGLVLRPRVLPEMMMAVGWKCQRLSSR